MKIRGRSKAGADIPQSSLGDIAFLLLIFFIATTMFDIEMGIPLVLPGNISKSVTVNRKNVLTVSSDASGALYVDGEGVSPDDIHRRVEQRLAENPELVVSIETHPDAKYGAMITMLDEVKKAKASKISLRMSRG